MTAEANWDSTRWRDADLTPRYDGLQQPQQAHQHHPRMSAAQDSHAAIKDSFAQPWYNAPHDSATQQYGYSAPRPSQPYAGQLHPSPPSQRHSHGGNAGPPNSTSFSNASSYIGSWRNESTQDSGANDTRAADAPLSLHIPNKAAELSSIPHGYTTPRSDAPQYSSGTSSWSHHATSLPSFAALSEQAGRTDEPDEVEIAPMSARLSCAQCAKLGPLVREVAAAVAELDGSVQSLCGTAVARSPEVPSNESAMRTMQWILDRMRYTKRDIHEVARSSGNDQSRSQHNYYNSLKRSGDQWDQDDMPTLKLPRPNTSHMDASSSDRRMSVDFATRDPVQRSAYSPAPSDSAPESAYPRHGSPTSGRVPRALPSPSSLAFPPSGPASFVPANAGSIGSPGTSYHPGSSIHTVSTNSATSAHLQDLQHQVSLKSLALQTLQTEYATLLQKLQRERIKSQTIEKKTTVADQEVNDLTTRNEELLEQIKTLEGQLVESEKKRESEREEAGKEKEQWSRMLDMSGRIQNKNAEAHQRLVKEKADLVQRLATYETGGSARADRSATPAQSDPSRRSSPPTAACGTTSALTTLPSVSTSNDVEGLRRENASLQAKVTMLQSSLDEIRREYVGIEMGIQNLAAQKDMLRRMLDAAAAAETIPKADQRTDMSGQDSYSGSRPKTPSPPELSFQGRPACRPSDNPSRLQTESAAQTKAKGSSTTSFDMLSPENLAQVARAVSPGPAELGFHVQPSTSSPEELIRALGPVPAPLPSIRLSSSYDDPASLRSGSPSRAGRRQSQPFLAPLSLPDSDPGSGPSSFRPLNHQPSPYQTPTSLYSTAPSPSHSHYSSPGGGANLSNTSSPGSTSTTTHSPEYTGFSRRHSQPQLQSHGFAAAGSGSAGSPRRVAMPPPPRPIP